MELHLDITGDDKVVSKVIEKMMGAEVMKEAQESTTGGARNARRTHANAHSMHANTRNTESHAGRIEETPPGPSEEERSGR
jgi:hypothetical protein